MQLWLFYITYMYIESHNKVSSDNQWVLLYNNNAVLGLKYSKGIYILHDMRYHVIANGGRGEVG